MPLWTFNLIFFGCIVATLVAGIWLLLNLNAVARLFAGSSKRGEMVPAPGVRRVPPGRVWLMLAIFNLGWIGCAAIWVYTIDREEANAVVDAAA